MPSVELFEKQSQQYRESVFPKGVPVVSIEAMSTFGWAKYAHASLGIETFGESAPAKHVFKHFGLVPDQVAAKVLKVIDHYKTVTPEWKVEKLF